MNHSTTPGRVGARGDTAEEPGDGVHGAIVHGLRGTVGGMPTPLEDIARRLGVAEDAVTPQAIFEYAFPGVAPCLRDHSLNPRAEQARSHGIILLDGARGNRTSYVDSFNAVRNLLRMPGTAEAITACGARIPAELSGGTSLLGGPSPGGAGGGSGRVAIGVGAAVAALGLGLAVTRPEPLMRFFRGR